MSQCPENGLLVKPGAGRHGLGNPPKANERQSCRGSREIIITLLRGCSAGRRLKRGNRVVGVIARRRHVRFKPGDFFALAHTHTHTLL